MEIAFAITSLVFLAAFVVVLIFALRTARQLRSTEEMIVDTIADIEEVATVFDTLVNRRSLLADDPDIQKIRQVFGVTLDILGEFLKNARFITEGAQEETQKEEE